MRIIDNHDPQQPVIRDVPDVIGKEYVPAPEPPPTTTPEQRATET